jgi:Tol biopolymer transport system component
MKKVVFLFLITTFIISPGITFAQNFNQEVEVIHKMQRNNIIAPVVPVFADKGKKFAYKAFVNTGEWNKAVINNIETTEKYHHIKNPALSSDGNHYIYTYLKSGEEKKVRLDGEEYYSSEKTISAPFFSHDDKNIIFTLSDNNQQAVVINGEKQKNYTKVYVAPRYQFYSGNGNNYAYLAQQGEDMFIVYNGEKQKSFYSVSHPILNYSGDKFAYIAQESEENKQKAIYINDKKIGDYQDISDEFIFSPNGEKLAYVAKDNGYWFLFINGEKYSDPYYEIKNLIFSNDSNNISYVAKKDSSTIFIKGEKLPKKYGEVYHLIISPDENHYAFVSRNKDKEFVILDGNKGPEFAIGLSGYAPVFSPDSKHLVYKGSRFNKNNKRVFYIVIDNKKEIKAEGSIYTNVNQLNQDNGKNFVFEGNYVIYNSIRNKEEILRVKIKLDDKYAEDSSVNYSLINRLKGQILLQVESDGEAYYVYPKNNKKYFLGRPADAFNVMRELGLGVKHDFITSYTIYPDNVLGKILLDVEENGEAYYINPKDKRAYFLGRPADAFNVMRELGLGITNNDLNMIPSGSFNY